MEIKKLKSFLRITHDADDEFLETLLETTKTYIKEQTGVEYNPNDNIYFHAVILLSAHFYDNRSYVTEKSVNTVPSSLNCLIKHIGMRGVKNE